MPVFGIGVVKVQNIYMMGLINIGNKNKNSFMEFLWFWVRRPPFHKRKCKHALDEGAKSKEDEEGDRVMETEQDTTSIDGDQVNVNMKQWEDSTESTQTVIMNQRDFKKRYSYYQETKQDKPEWKTTRYKWSFLHEAVATNDIQSIKYFVRWFPHMINCQDVFGSRPLSIAAQLGDRTKVAAHLVRKGAKIYMHNTQHNMLVVAINNGHEDMARWILTNVDHNTGMILIEQKNKDGKNAFVLAANNPKIHDDFIEFLHKYSTFRDQSLTEP